MLPLISSVLMPRWPRPFWGPFYESVVAAPLARSMFDLLLPRTLGFKATPKGIVTQGRRFDWRSAKWTMLLAVITLAAICKGTWELVTFGIERDAYFFNMIWASYNLFFPARSAVHRVGDGRSARADNRVPCEIAARIENGASVHATTRDVSLSGCSLVLDQRIPLPYSLRPRPRVEQRSAPARGAASPRARSTPQPRRRALRRAVGGCARQALLLAVFARSDVWEEARATERRGRFALAASFFVGFVNAFRGTRTSSRRYPMRRVLRFPRRVGRNRKRRVWLRDQSPGGAGLLCTGRRPRNGELWRISELRWGRVVHTRRRLLLFWRVGLEEVEEPADRVLPAWEDAA